MKPLSPQHPEFSISLLGADPNWIKKVPPDRCAIIWPVNQAIRCLVNDSHLHVPKFAFLITRLCEVEARGNGLFVHIEMTVEYLDRLLHESEALPLPEGPCHWLARPSGKRLETAKKYFFHLWNEFEQELPHYRMAIHASLCGLLCHLLRNPSSPHQEDLYTVPTPEQDRSTSEGRVYSLIARLRGEYVRDWKLGELCREAGVNRSTLNTLFRRATGQPPLAFLQTLRLRKAGELLRSTDLTVAEIAAQAGYPDERHFYRLFRSRMGKTPGEYRKSEGKSAGEEDSEGHF